MFKKNNQLKINQDLYKIIYEKTYIRNKDEFGKITFHELCELFEYELFGNDDEIYEVIIEKKIIENNKKYIEKNIYNFKLIWCGFENTDKNMSQEDLKKLYDNNKETIYFENLGVPFGKRTFKEIPKGEHKIYIEKSIKDISFCDDSDGNTLDEIDNGYKININKFLIIKIFIRKETKFI